MCESWQDSRVLGIKEFQNELMEFGFIFAGFILWLALGKIINPSQRMKL
jgi:hypothetical protein